MILDSDNDKQIELKLEEIHLEEEEKHEDEEADPHIQFEFKDSKKTYQSRAK